MKKALAISFILLISIASVWRKDALKGIPKPIRKKIEQLKKEEMKNPPVSVYEYVYAGKKVYYFTPYCCDVSGQLYNAAGNLICEPDGGITGTGDGKCTDFFDKRTNERLLWKDLRK